MAVRAKSMDGISGMMRSSSEEWREEKKYRPITEIIVPGENRNRNEKEEDIYDDRNDYAESSFSSYRPTKQEMMESVIKLRKMIIKEKEECKKKEKELLKIKKKFVESQRNIPKLRFEIRKSTIILDEYTKRDHEYFITHPLTDAGQVHCDFD